MEEQLVSVRRRQEQIFVKQDQIQSTLHGETPLLQSPTSAVLCSPPFTHVSDSISGYKVCAQQHTQQHTSDLSSMLRESDFDSIISLDWGDPNLQLGPAGAVPSAVAGPSSTVGPAGALLSAGAGPIAELYSTVGPAGAVPSAVGEPSATMGHAQAGTSGNTTAMLDVGGTSRMDCETFPSTLPCGSITPQLESTAFMPQQKTLHAGAAGAPQEQDPDKLLEKIQTISIKDVGKVARMLAFHLFGENVFKNSTIRGDVKRGLQCLDPTKVGRLTTSIHRHPSFANLPKAEFDNTVAKTKILPSVSHYCKELRHKGLLT